MRGGRFMSVEDIIFLMRKDKVGLVVIFVKMFVKLILSCSYIHRGYYTATQRYKIYLQVLNIYYISGVSTANE